ncbi:hypothetical protein [Clostridium baratii]|uniref:hypothetical protein n=1 Tax=Clostridium baratii TaxID=1561 RepID=UPI002901A3DD|nr:hypothetical protein [Clostridium baratii]MDU1053457.1 hypothetical protein [Clostridium baratii]
MNINEYKEIVKETALNEYPSYYQDKIIKSLKEKELVFNDKRSKNKKKLLDISSAEKSKDKLRIILDNLPVGVKEIEKFEYDRAYRYCALFSIYNYSDSLLDDLKKLDYIKEFSDNVNEFDTIKFTAMKPTYKIDSEKTILKFSFLLKNKEDNTKSIKYTVLAIIYKQIDVLEIRLDTIHFVYKEKEEFYNDKIHSVLAWLDSVLNLKIKNGKRVHIRNIDFEPTVKYMKSQKTDDVTIVALKMRRDGMMAYLDASSNEDLTIPILGELKKLLTKNECVFNRNKDTKEINELLDTFIKEIEETSSLPSVKILWREKKIKVLLTHNYRGEKYTLFKYSDELSDKEMMGYVTRYLIECKKELDEESVD